MRILRYVQNGFLNAVGGPGRACLRASPEPNLEVFGQLCKMIQIRPLGQDNLGNTASESLLASSNRVRF